jgi:hypothetical protein
VNFCYFLLSIILLSACARPHNVLIVKQFLLRDQASNEAEEPMIKMEKERRLRDAISITDRRNRLGKYYTLLWSDPLGVSQGEVELVFEYQQGASASLVKRISYHFPASSTKGQAEFAVIGDNYFNGGRVLTWKATLLRKQRVLATRQSYLWQ